MGVINWVAFGGVIVDLVIISIIISNAFWGYRKGLVDVIFKILSFIVALVIMFLLYKPASNAIIERTKIDDWLAEKIAEVIQGTSLADGELMEYDPDSTEISAGMVEILNSFVKEALQEATDNVVVYVSVHISQLMIRVGTMLLLFIVSRTLLFFVRFAAELIGNLPFIKMFNKSGGLIYGLIKGFLTIYIILAIFSIASPLIKDWGVIDAVQDSTLGKKMYNDNIIVNMVLK